MSFVATVALAAVAAAPARATTVELRVEAAGVPAPLFAGPVSTQPHAVDGGDGTGVHPCAGPAGAPPSATATDVLDDAMRASGISWRGNWDPDFRDFFIERIGAYASRAPDVYWSLTVDGRYAPGGCETTLAEGDEVRFFYGPLFGEQPGVEGGAGGGDGGPGSGAGAGGGSAAGGPVAPSPPAVAPVTAHPGRLAARAARYLRRHRDGVGELWSRLALALRSAGAGGPVAGAAAVLLRGRDRARGGPSIDVAPTVSMLGGLRADDSFGEDVDATAIAVIALGRSSPHPASRAAGWLARVEGPTGGFGFRRGVPPDVDTTGLAAWALAREGRGAAARRAAQFIASSQSPDGGFPSLPGGESNAQSTGLALVGLRAGRLGVAGASSSGATPIGYLEGLARGDGSIGYATGSAPTPVWTTAQALLGLLPRRKLMRR